MSFIDLRLAEPIVRAVSREGYATPTPIQKQAIPEILAGRDVLGCAQTGTGKTAAFALPILHLLAAPSQKDGSNHRGANGRFPRALVLCPTRELASQIYDSFITYGRGLPLRHAVVYGGVSQFHQVKALRAGVDVLIATPGRLLDLMEQGHIDLRMIEMLVLDEADRMLDMGFIRDIRRIAERLPARRQTLLFSATMPAEIRALADSMLNKPAFVQAAHNKANAEAVTQSVYLVSRNDKPVLLERLLRSPTMDRTLVFTRTKHGADRLVKQLKRAGIGAGAIHSNKSQSVRTQALNGFKAGTTRVLIATDIASRGIDVDDVSHVVNFDMPNTAETYVHRIGRTARAGALGIAVSFCDRDELEVLRAIERLIRKPLEVNEDEPDLAVRMPVSRAESSQRDSQASVSRKSRNGQKDRSTHPGMARDGASGKHRQRPSNRRRRGAATGSGSR